MPGSQCPIRSWLGCRRAGWRRQRGGRRRFRRGRRRRRHRRGCHRARRRQRRRCCRQIRWRGHRPRRPGQIRWRRHGVRRGHRCRRERSRRFLGLALGFLFAGRTIAFRRFLRRGVELGLLAALVRDERPDRPRVVDGTNVAVILVTVARRLQAASGNAPLRARSHGRDFHGGRRVRTSRNLRPARRAQTRRAGPKHGCFRTRGNMPSSLPPAQIPIFALLSSAGREEN